MLSILMALAATQAQPAVTTPPAAPARTLQSVPGVTVKYYDVAGRNGGAIEKSLKKILATPAPNNTAARVFDWSMGLKITKRTEGTVCTITAADADFTSNAYLPRLTEEASVPKDVLANWKPYAEGLEKTASDNLWFVADRIPALEQSLVGKPCDQAAPLWKAGVDNLNKQQNEFAKQAADSAKAVEDAIAKTKKK